MNDKQQHFTVWYAFALTVGLFSVPAAVVLGLITAVGKEIWDKYVRKTVFSWADIGADVLGILAALVALFLRTRLIG